MNTELTGLPPIVSPLTRLLILGSFPGQASLAAQQYYGHPQNHFWRILRAVWPSRSMDTGVGSYQKNTDWLLSKGLGLWDVYAACERRGSLDSQIRKAQMNDFSMLNQLCPSLQAVAHNGAQSFKHAGQVNAAFSAPAVAGTKQAIAAITVAASSVRIQFYKLPSTSPANASWSFERKLAAWRGVFEEQGLI